MTDLAIEPPTDVSEPEVPADEELVEEDLLVEDVSIDGMCGVY
jgi:mycofactocin precursor